METKRKGLVQWLGSLYSKMSYLFTCLGVFAAMGLPMFARAEADASGMMIVIIGIIANLIVALSILLALLGVVHYASAHSEGDGPAKQKAVMQIAAGVMLMLASILVKSNVNNLVSYMTT